jgi:IS30 family transposase
VRRLSSKEEKSSSLNNLVFVRREIPRRGKVIINYVFFYKKYNKKIYLLSRPIPWQKGANENFNGRLRHFLPKKSDISNVSQSDLDHIAHIMNNTPRKCLDYKTLNEAFSAALRTRCNSS